MEPRAARPLDSRITLATGVRGEDLVGIPGAGVDPTRLCLVAFLALWLVGWVAVVAVAGWVGMGSSYPLLWRVPLLSFLAAWAVAGVFAGEALLYLLLAMFGEESLTFDAAGLVHVRRLFGVQITRRYASDRISRFDYAAVGQRHALIAWFAGRERMLLCTMWLDRRRLPVAVGLRADEARWIAGQLNALLEQHRR
jgi:hypothetical protein